MQSHPTPSPHDLAEATRFIDGAYAATVDPDYLARHREKLIRYAADAVMQSRMGAEHRARFATQRRAA